MSPYVYGVESSSDVCSAPTSQIEVPAILQNSSSVPGSSASAMSSKSIAPLHVVDQVVFDIARRFRFTTEEVKEYYDKCGEMERTRTRFQQMRQLLQDKFGDQ